STNNLEAYANNMLAPINKGSYYSFRVDDTAGRWTAKFIITACNMWSATQSSWLQSELAVPTTYTFVARHHPLGSNGPCNLEMDGIIRASTTINGFLTGHTHTVYFSGSAKELVEGVGGAPITGTANYGYA